MNQQEPINKSTQRALLEKQRRQAENDAHGEAEVAEAIAQKLNEIDPTLTVNKLTLAPELRKQINQKHVTISKFLHPETGERVIEQEKINGDLSAVRFYSAKGTLAIELCILDSHVSAILYYSPETVKEQEIIDPDAERTRTLGRDQARAFKHAHLAGHDVVEPIKTEAQSSARRVKHKRVPRNPVAAENADTLDVANSNHQHAQKPTHTPTEIHIPGRLVRKEIYNFPHPLNLQPLSNRLLSVIEYGKNGAGKETNYTADGKVKRNAAGNVDMSWVVSDADDKDRIELPNHADPFMVGNVARRYADSVSKSPKTGRGHRDQLREKATRHDDHLADKLEHDGKPASKPGTQYCQRLKALAAQRDEQENSPSVRNGATGRC